MMGAAVVEVRGVPGWMPPELADAVAGLVEPRPVELTRGECKVLRKPRKIQPSEWAERHRVVHESRISGRWRNDSVPYAAGILDASFFPSVGTVIIQKCVQSGGSEAVHTCIGYAVDRDPGPAMYVFPNRDTARENSQDRILPMLESSRRLAEHMTGVDDDRSSLRIRLKHMAIYLAWAGSAARLANKPIRHLVLDELNKYPVHAGRDETSPEKLAEARTTTYEGFEKIWKISTPTVPSGAITRALSTEAERVYVYHMRCPDCGFYHLPEFKNIQWPEDERDPRKIESEGLAWYVCPHCGSCWDEFKRRSAVRVGEWRDADTDVPLFPSLRAARPRRIGFKIPAWISPFVSMGKIAAAFLRAQPEAGPDWKTALKNFTTQYEGEPWEIHEQQRAEDAILALRDDRPSGILPLTLRKGVPAISVLTAGVDTQDDGWWYEVRAWGFGRSLESWMVRAGFLFALEDLTSVLWGEPYRDPEGREMPVRLAVIDSQGHRTTEVYEWCRLNRGRALPLKGHGPRMTAPVSYSKLDYYPSGGKQAQREIPGGLRLLNANVSVFKDQLAALLAVRPGDPGGWHMNADCTEAWARQMCAEYVDENGLWVCPKGRANHGWDCGVYNLVGAHVLRVAHLEPVQPVRRVQPQRVVAQNSFDEERRW